MTIKKETSKARAKAIGAQLKNWREKHDLTQVDVSVDLDMNSPAYQAYEEGRAEPSLTTLKKLANLYNLPTIEDLIDFSVILSI